MLRLIRWSKLTGQGGELFVLHVEREPTGTHFLLTFEKGGALSYGSRARGTASQINRAFDRLVENTQAGVELYRGQWELVDEGTRADAEIKRMLDVFTHPTFGLKWDQEEGSTAEPESDMDEFHALLEKQTRDWKGSSNSLAVSRHRYWPTFRELIREAVQKKYGSKFRLYRGIHGRQARDLLHGSQLRVNRFSSWAEREGAREYRGDRGDFWVVVSAPFSPDDVVLAPVQLPDYTPDPDVLARFGSDVQHHGDEFVIESSSGTVPGWRISERTRKRLAHYPAYTSGWVDHGDHPMSKTANVSTRWLLEQSLRAAAEAQMEIRTPKGYMIGQGPDHAITAAWLAFQLGLGYQTHHLQNMTISGENAELFLSLIGTDRPEAPPLAGTGFLKSGVWWVWSGSSWIKGTRPVRDEG